MVWTNILIRSQERYLNMLALLTALCLLAALTGSPRALAAPLVVVAEPITLDPAAPARTRFGDLTFLFGYQLRSDDSRFGGLSGLALDPTGNMLYAISDHGFGLSARLFHDADGRLVYLDMWEIVPLLPPATQVSDRGQLDAEALVRQPDGSFLVAFEHIHRLWRYPPSPLAFATSPQPLPVPSELTHAPDNGGIEAMTRLLDGQLLLLSEAFKNRDGSFKGWIIGGDRIAPVAYRPTDGYFPTDLATLANGDLLLLERRYVPLLGAAARIRRLARASVQAGARLEGAEIVHLERPLMVDNFEGLAVHERTGTGTRLYLISDDNYHAFQRTLLLQFRLESRPGD
jgi:hypothetical protein